MRSPTPSDADPPGGETVRDFFDTQFRNFYGYVHYRIMERQLDWFVEAEDILRAAILRMTKDPWSGGPVDDLPRWYAVLDDCLNEYVCFEGTELRGFTAYCLRRYGMQWLYTAEDIIYEVYSGVRADNERLPEKMGFWKTCLRNRCIDKRRKREETAPTEDDERESIVNSIPTVEIPPEDRLHLGRELRRCVGRCTRRKDPLFQKIIRLSIEGYPPREIAERLDMTAQRVSRHIENFRACVRRCMPDEV